MFLHIGEDVTIYKSDIVGIFDMEKTTTTKETRNYLNGIEKEIIYVSEEDPKSFIVVNEEGSEKIYISPISVATLKERLLRSTLWQTKI
ncbi:MAG: DUF370 domain-containing protein [Ruminococcaceae bacterium]|nr:DUF370 domain-containing protein [Oscillospiraceae bacterium]